MDAAAGADDPKCSFTEDADGNRLSFCGKAYASVRTLASPYSSVPPKVREEPCPVKTDWGR
jgi:hypothetical protein